MCRIVGTASRMGIESWTTNVAHREDLHRYVWNFADVDVHWDRTGCVVGQNMKLFNLLKGYLLRCFLSRSADKEMTFLQDWGGTADVRNSLQDPCPCRKTLAEVLIHARMLTECLTSLHILT
jgi:hypothetical protein